ncbi:hypothetical protein A9Q91_02340 [Candidatus Gracilibacteria bacterium 28_42_T64]|nr:hypothetical protein A9Q91_02340 [Candidatus Gracilibacteria bacterium 28_42_T64]
MTLLKILFAFSIFTGLILGVYSFSLLSGQGNDDTVASTSVDDTYILDDSNQGVKNQLTSKFSSDYSSGKRLVITQPDTSGSGFIVSEQYGDFYIKNEITLTKDAVMSPSCSTTESVSYSFSGTLESPSWGEVSITSSSYYCPASKKFFLPLYSDVIGFISISATGSKTVITGVQSSEDIAKDIADSAIFNSNKVSVSGLTSSKDISGTQSELSFDYSDSENSQKFVNIDYDIASKKANFDLVINKNIARLTSGLTPINNNSSALTGFSQDLHYYDFSGVAAATSQNEQNFGRILTVGNGGAGDTSFNKMVVAGSKTLIVKGGNVYINADIYNTSDVSLLVIIVKKDSTNKNNGGNIYIDPKVTNIDAVLIADGSILSYNSSVGVLTASNSSHLSSLTKQLLIYGSISTKNTIGDDNAPYGSDGYIANGEGVDQLYNLEYLRAFEVEKSNDIDDALFCYGLSDIASKGGEEYAFAGKKRCYITDSVASGLRSTEKVSALVIEYNPRISLNPPKILQKY